MLDVKKTDEVKADMGMCDRSSYKGGTKAALVSGPAPPTGQEKTGTSSEDGRTHRMDTFRGEERRGRRRRCWDPPLPKVTFRLQLLQKDISHHLQVWMFFSTAEIKVSRNIILSFYSHENHFYVFYF